MKDLVHGKSPGLAESLATLGTLEGLLFGMDVAVITEMILPSEGLATNITIERALIRVSALVDEQVVRFGELSVAVLANKSLLWSGGSTRTSKQPGIVRLRVGGWQRVF